MRLMDISITRKLILAFSMVVATVLVMSGVVLMSSFSHSAADVSSAAADQVQVLIERAKADTFNASSSFRGFQLTRSEASVQQIESSEADFAKDLKAGGYRGHITVGRDLQTFTLTGKDHM